jgi:hypothetical protein
MRRIGGNCVNFRGEMPIVKSWQSIVNLAFCAAMLPMDQ